MGGWLAGAAMSCMHPLDQNRTQKELSEGLTAAEARRSEERFFSQHDFFRGLDQRLFGVDNLTARLTELLVDRWGQHTAPPQQARSSRRG